MNEVIDSTVSIFNDIPMATMVEVFSKTKSFQEDKSPTKVNLAIGAYRDDEGKPYILPVVAWAEQNLPDVNDIEHSSIFGYQSFTEAACRLLMGDNHDVFCRKKVFGIQCISGTGGLRLAGDYLLHVLKYKNIYIPSPSFGNHEHLYNYLGFEVRNYRYWDYEKQDIDLNSLIQDLTVQNQQPLTFP
uniref:aspartate transaminase n=1 Tax=Romanomermis culicivorax TaxID=13658 RepID=A0A915ITJ3_ROMCU